MVLPWLNESATTATELGRQFVDMGGRRLQRWQGVGDDGATPELRRLLQVR